MYLFIFLSVILALLPSSAFAGNIFDPATSSTALDVVNALFPSIVNGGVDPFAGIMLQWNAMVLIICGILAAYTILASTVGTAHDGKFMGKNFHPVWLPIRYAVATGLVIPVKAGYCTIQMLVVWLVIQGIGLGDQVWATYTSTTNITKSVSAGITRPDTRAFTYKLLETLTCESVVSKITKYPNADLLGFQGSDFGMTKTPGLISTVYSWGDRNEIGGFTKDSCGTISVKNWSVPAVNTSSNIINFFFNVGQSIDRMRDINQEHQNQVATLISALQPYADQIANGQAVSFKTIDGLANAYEEAVRLKAANTIQSMDAFQNFSQNASRNGFFTAGAFYLPISFMADMVQRSVADVPTASGPGAMTNALAAQNWAEAQATLKAILDQADIMITTRTTFGVASATGADKGAVATIKDMILSGFDLNKIVDKAFGETTNFMIQDGENPLMAMTRMGHWLFGIASAAYGALTFLTVSVGNAPGIGSALTLAVVMFVTPILLAGFLLTYVFPLMPFFIWIGAVTAWVLLVIEAVVAAPLWAMMHLTPQGHDAMGSGQAGYRLVTSLLLRPVLMVFGLIAALTMTQVVGDVLNKLWAGVFLLSQTDSGLLIKIFGCLVAAPILYGAMMFTFTKKMFDVITHLPDELLNWIGGGGPQLGRFAEDMGGDKSHTYVAAGVVARAAGQGAETLRSNKLGKAPVETDPTMEAKMKNADMKSGAINQAGQQAKGEDSSEPKFKSFSESKQQDQAQKAEDAKQAVDTQFSNIEDTLGGEGSPEYESFSTQFKKEMEENPNAPVLSNMNTAFNRELNRHFGKLSGGNLKEISGGSYAGDTFKEAVAKYRDTHKALDNAGYDAKESKQLIASANDVAKSHYMNDKESSYHKKEDGKNLYEYLKPELDNLKLKNMV
ncbi:DotA/TraY family protein [Burkholderia cenocepacia]|uniref:DotA/TraY family protein n=1 Tax=Burkholderia cenocepacia TaxID=95486 RepID=UPI002237C94D|nr:DotA/TraY family protein [Burkholderia cenocepacia]MCW5156288.1 DotA/TraY family protein [Burkholderia cenocepacia]